MNQLVDEFYAAVWQQYTELRGHHLKERRLVQRFQKKEIPRDAPALTSDRCERDAGSLLKLSVAIFRKLSLTCPPPHPPGIGPSNCKRNNTYGHKPPHPHSTARL